MKLKLTAPKIVNLIIGLVVLFFIITFASIFMIRIPNSYSSSDSYSSSETTNPLPPIDAVLSEDLPQRVYKRLKDSIEMNRTRANSMYFTSAGELGPIGWQKSERCEGCTFLMSTDELKRLTKKEYLIRLTWWKLDSADVFYPARFYVKNGQSYIRKNICKLTSKTGQHNSYNCVEKDFAVPYRYDTKRKNVMIPISADAMKVVTPIAMGIAILYAIYFLYFVIGNFIKFLITIAQGDPFSEINLKRLKVITLSLFFFPIALFLLNFLPYFIFHKYFSSDIVLNMDFWKELGKPAVLYLIFAAIWAAFRKGKQLKEDNDLTV